MTCQTCIHRDPSSNPDYGYCKAGHTPLERARLLPVTSPCVWDPSRFLAGVRHG